MSLHYPNVNYIKIAPQVYLTQKHKLVSRPPNSIGEGGNPYMFRGQKNIKKKNYLLMAGIKKIKNVQFEWWRHWAPTIKRIRNIFP